MSDISDLVTQIRTLLNVTDEPLTDAEIIAAINDAYKEVATRGECVEETYSLSVLPGQKIYELPRRNFTWSYGQTVYPLHPVMVNFVSTSVWIEEETPGSYPGGTYPGGPYPGDWMGQGVLMPVIYQYAWLAGTGRQDYDPTLLSVDGMFPSIAVLAEKV